MLTKATKLLNEVFGYEEFRPFQKDVIASVLDHKDTLAVMPTGAGKSLCFQIPALVFEGLTLVISPLIALMDDQVAQMRRSGLAAAMLNSSLDFDTYQETAGEIRRGEIRLLYIAPETLLKKGIVELLTECDVRMIAVDESHCISEWGHDFRPEYRMLGALRSYFPKAVWLALTATATPQVREDIKTTLGISGGNTFVAPFDRPNLFLQVQDKSDPFIQLTRFLEKHPGESGIVYCLARKTTEEVARKLEKRGYKARFYHAGMADVRRKKSQELFLKGKADIVVATVAFGMGIHKDDIRFVVHYDLPKSIESYYQEIGRAGRNGKESHCLLLYSYKDCAKLKYFINRKSGEAEKAKAMDHLNAMVSYAESEKCRRGPLLSYFGENSEQKGCGFCDNCTETPVQKSEAGREAKMFLSCVKRLDERFGITYVIDVLRGSRARKILDNGHDTLSTWGIGRALSKEKWTEFGRAFIKEKLLRVDPEYRTLSLTEKGYSVMRGELTVEIALSPVEKAREGVIKSSSKESELFELLRKTRYELARTEGVPPYRIFNDKTLHDMVLLRPTDHTTMLAVNGVGERKLDLYGDIFLRCIRSFEE